MEPPAETGALGNSLPLALIQLARTGDVGLVASLLRNPLLTNPNFAHDGHTALMEVSDPTVTHLSNRDDIIKVLKGDTQKQEL